MGLVSLTVSNLEKSERFYKEVIGLTALSRIDSTLALGSETQKLPGRTFTSPMQLQYPATPRELFQVGRKLRGLNP